MIGATVNSTNCCSSPFSPSIMASASLSNMADRGSGGIAEKVNVSRGELPEIVSTAVEPDRAEAVVKEVGNPGLGNVEVVGNRCWDKSSALGF